MTLKEFITKELRPNPQHPDINDMIERLSQDANFPNTEDVKAMARYLYADLDQDHTTAFQKILMIWKYAENGYKQPTDDNILLELNYIITLQTNDPNYKYADEIPAHINHKR